MTIVVLFLKLKSIIEGILRTSIGRIRKSIEYSRIEVSFCFSTATLGASTFRMTDMVGTAFISRNDSIDSLYNSYRILHNILDCFEAIGNEFIESSLIDFTSCCGGFFATDCRKKKLLFRHSTRRGIEKG